MKLSLCIAWLVCVGAAFGFLLEPKLHFFDEKGIYSSAQVAVMPPFLSIILAPSKTDLGIEVAEMPQTLEQQLTVNLSAPTKIIHWLDPLCNCYRFAKSLILNQITNAKSDENHLVILKSTDTFWDSQAVTVHVLSADEYQQSIQFMPASPAATIHQSNQHNVSYLGPHSSGSYCGQGKSFIAIAMSNVRAGFDPNFLNVNESGCFCPW